MILPPPIQPPPARYELPGQMVIVSFLPQDDVHRACKPFVVVAPGSLVLGCAISSKAACTVTLPTPASWRGTGEAYRELVDHELGHCAGWPANHPSRLKGTTDR